MFIKLQRQALYNFKIQLTCSKSVQVKKSPALSCRQAAGDLQGLNQGAWDAKTFFCKKVFRQELNPWFTTQSLMAQPMHHEILYLKLSVTTGIYVYQLLFINLHTWAAGLPVLPCLRPQWHTCNSIAEPSGRQSRFNLLLNRTWTCHKQLPQGQGQPGWPGQVNED